MKNLFIAIIGFLAGYGLSYAIRGIKKLKESETDDVIYVHGNDDLWLSEYMSEDE